MVTLAEYLNIIRSDLFASLKLWLPELVLLAAVILILLQRMLWPAWRRGTHLIALVGAVVALGFLLSQYALMRSAESSVAGSFLGMVQLDSLAWIFRTLILLFTVLFVILTWLSRWPRFGHAAEFYVLFLGSAIGMLVMVTAENLLVVFLAMEMASVPTYILAGFEKRQRRAGEAAMKLAIFGAAMSGVMLYGLSLLGGALGSLSLPVMGANLATLVGSADLHGQTTVLVLGTLLVLAGIGFKLSAVPFHFWLPDVFEGAAAEVGAFLSVISKAAALGLLTRLCLTLLGPSVASGAFSVAPLMPFVVGTLSLLAAVTCTYGNLAAYGQTNFKRLLGYSTIAHAGYLMMPLAAATALLPVDVTLARWAIATMVFYLVVYLFMNLVAFGAAAFLRNQVQSELIDDYAGLVKTAPGFVVCVALAMFSLIGLPPLGGFVGKFVVFASLVSAQLWALFFVAALNTALSLFYYVRVIKVMVLDHATGDRSFRLPMLSASGIYLVLITIPVVGLGIFWQPVFDVVSQAVGGL